MRLSARELRCCHVDWWAPGQSSVFRRVARAYERSWSSWPKRSTGSTATDAVPDIARVLRPGGRLALVWNLRDESVPWVRELWTVIAPDEPRLITHAELPPGAPFGPMERTTFGHVQRLDRDGVLDLALSRSYVAVQPAERRAMLLAAASAVLDTHAPGGSVTLPYLAHCFRAQRVPR